MLSPVINGSGNEVIVLEGYWGQRIVVEREDPWEAPAEGDPMTWANFSSGIPVVSWEAFASGVLSGDWEEFESGVPEDDWSSFDSGATSGPWIDFSS